MWREAAPPPSDVAVPPSVPTSRDPASCCPASCCLPCSPPRGGVSGSSFFGEAGSRASADSEGGLERGVRGVRERWTSPGEGERQGRGA